MLALDVSNYTDSFTAADVQRWRAAGVGLVIVQAVDPPPPYPPTQTRQQIATLAEAGMPVDAYVWLWFESELADIERKLALLDGLSIGRLWLDVEDVDTGTDWYPAWRINRVRQALALLDAYKLEPRAGIYTGAWYWRLRMDDTSAFADRPLWAAQYDGQPDASVFVPFGGWQSCAIKQYAGTSTFEGIAKVDLNVLSRDEEARVTTENPCAGLINALGYLRGDVRDRLYAEAVRKYGPRRQPILEIVAEIDRVGEQFLGPRES